MHSTDNAPGAGPLLARGLPEVRLLRLSPGRGGLHALHQGQPHPVQERLPQVVRHDGLLRGVQQGDPGLRDGHARQEQRLPLGVLRLPAVQPQVRGTAGFCVGDRFYLCDNKILCEYDYEERLVFANMAYNPSSLAHIRRQVSNLQPAGDHLSGRGGDPPPRLAAAPGADKLTRGCPGAPQQGRDDGSSGYGSPDSGTFEAPCN
ncbi:uncharacterized protein LOC134537016 isoform X3 [Bacillus rossius redtenbacheri]|uniref:uncharacterized protein LOC134537016 isoform X3 n=1 Tax=Bacillus rossius redtenbacheri TaxID=93214 RepID=UPI002FDEF405